MTAVWFGQQRSQAVRSGFESLSCQIFYDLSLTFSIPEFIELFTQKIFDGNL